MKTTKNTKGGFIHTIVLFAIFCVIIWYFKLDVRGYIDTHPQIRDPLLKMIDFLKGLWNSYLKGAWAFIWNNIINDLIWKNLAPYLSKLGK